VDEDVAELLQGTDGDPELIRNKVRVFGLIIKWGEALHQRRVPLPAGLLPLHFTDHCS